MRAFAVFLLAFLAHAGAKECPANKANSKLFCYFSKLTDVDGCRCSFVILPPDSDVKAVDRVRETFKGIKILVTVNEFNQGLIDILKTSKVDGLEIDLKKLDSKNDITEFISTVRSKLGSDLYVALSVPARAETLAKYYDFKGLSKHADVFILQTAFMGASKNVTFHPSRLSGLWDTQNTDSMVDLVSGLGAPLSKVVISAPVQAFHFTLQNGDYSAPGSPALELESITRKELCKEMRRSTNWTLERDQDQAGPYIFSGKDWIAFEDSSSIDVKAKYARVRGLAGLALKDVSQDDGGEECGSSVLAAAAEGLSRQARAPRGAVLRSLERELQEAASRPPGGVTVSPYRISRVIDVEGKVHVVRQDTRTEFSCSRQGFFAHPRSCNRFYRCVLFDQSSDEFSVFEFDCPAGLAFDERVEVCVWPGSLPEGQPCAGSSEIAPVPRSRFVCPHEPGYYADPENCRWFFACLDHGDYPLSAYEFRCPYGLVFDSDRLLCEWPWLVPRCSSGASLGEEYVFGGSGYASADALDRYNGLGSLGVIRLGGLSGQLPQPVIYTNIGGVRYPTAALGGLSIQATQSLHNAGLLRDSVQYSSEAAGGGSSFNQPSIGSSGSHLDHAGTGSFRFSSNSGLDASYSGQQQSAGLSHYEGSYNSAGGGAISDTILGLNGGNSFGTESLQNLLNRDEGSHERIKVKNSGLYQHQGGSYIHIGSSALGEGTQQFSNNNEGVSAISVSSQGVSNSASGRYSGNSQTGLDSSSAFGTKTTQQYLNNKNEGSYRYQGGSDSYIGSSALGQDIQHLSDDKEGVAANSGSYQGVTDSASGSYSINSQTGLDTSSSFGTKSTQQSLDNNDAGFYNVITDSGSSNNQGITNSGSGSSFGNSALGQDTQHLLRNNNGAVTNSGSSHYQGVTNSGSGRYFDSSNIGLDTSSTFGSKTTQQFLNNNNDGSYNGISNSGSSHYHGVSTTGSGSYAGSSNLGLDASDSFGTKTTHHYLNNNDGGSYDGISNPGSSHFLGVTDSGSESYVGSSNLGLDASSTFGTGTTQNYLYNNNGVSYNSIADSGSSHYQGVTNSGSSNYVANSNSGLVASTSGAQNILYNGGSSSYSNLNTGHSEANAFDAKKSEARLNTPSGASESYNSLNVQAGDSFDFESGKNGNSRTNLLETDHTHKQVVGDFNSALNQQGVSSGSTSGYYHTIINQGQNADDSSRLNYQHGVSGNINILGGGYSAVRQSNVQVTHNGENHIGLEQTTVAPVYFSVPASTPIPVSISTYSPVPTVTAVPVPTLSTPTAFEQYNGGVIANIPQLQFQAERFGLANTSLSSFSSTPYSNSQKYDHNQFIGASSYNSQSQSSGSLEVQGSSSTFRPDIKVPQSGGYIYNKPSIAFEEVPKGNSVLSPTTKPHSVIFNSNSDQNIQLSNLGFQGYRYERPSVAFEEIPLPRLETPVQSQVIVSSTIAPVITAQPISHTYSQNIHYGGYHYPKPSVAFIERPSQPAIISRFSIKAPVIQDVRPSVGVHTYKQEHEEGYRYEKPSITFEERPSQPVVLNYQQPTQKTKYTFKDIIQPVHPVSTYLPVSETSHVAQQTIRPVVSTYLPATERPIAVPPAHPGIIFNYTFEKPAVSSFTFHDVISQTAARPIHQVYSYSTTAQPVVIQSTIRPAIKFVSSSKRPAVVSNYNYVSSTSPRPVAAYTYGNPAPYVPQIVSTPASQIAIDRQFSGYSYPKPTAFFAEEPLPSVVTQVARQPVEETPFVKKTTYETGHIDAAEPVVIENYQAENYEKVRSKLFGQSATEVYYNSHETVSNTANPIQQVYTKSTPRPTYISTVASVIAPKGQEEDSDFHYYDSRYSTTPQIVKEGYLYLKPTVDFEEEPSKEYLPVTTSRPISRYSFSSLDDQYVSTESTTIVPREYLPVRTRIRVTTPVSLSTEPSTPSRDYLPVRSRVRVTTPIPTVTIPSRAYLPGRSRVRLTTAVPNREYLPADTGIRVTTHGADSGHLEVTSRRPIKVIKVVRPRTRTIIKQNDMHPILSAKLGAQCTCISNTINLRKKQKIIVVEDDEGDEDDGYVVGNVDQSGTIIENYEYESQRVVDITPTPDVYVQSTTNGIVVPSPTHRRVKVRPSSTVAYESEEDDSPSDEEIAKAVRTGLKLVKQAAKEGAKEGAEEVISNYSPRTGNSREGIECQRAGLFRHPNQCNKFYSCKWDCKKNKFTLHVFNCPVHLTFDNNLGACNWPSQGPACMDDTLLPHE